MARRSEHDFATSRLGPRIALLIDCENQSAAQAPRILAEAEQLGRVVQRTAYADWTKSHTGSWAEACKQHGIDQVQVNRTPTGKNTVDNYMSAAATRLAATAAIDAICLVTSDSDFSGAATNIRSMGKDVFGIGTASGAYKAFADTCTRFIALDERSSKPASKPKAAAPKPKAAVPKPKTPTPAPKPKSASAQARKTAKSAPKSKTTAPAAKPKTAVPKPNPKPGTPAPVAELPEDWRTVVDPIIDHLSSDSQWIHATAIGQLLSKRHPPFTYSHYGFKALIPMLQSDPDRYQIEPDPGKVPPAPPRAYRVSRRTTGSFIRKLQRNR